MRRFPALLLALLVLAVAPAMASAAPPANDDQGSAQAVPSLPANLTGTLVDATSDAADGTGTPSVWYRYIAATDGRFTAQLQANGNLDAQVAAFRQQRSSLVFLDSQNTDEKGKAGLSFRVSAGQTVIVRVAAQAASQLDTFSLVLSAAAPEVKPPGSPLATNGSTSTLDSVLHPVDAYSYSMAQGVTYRINMAPVEPPPTAVPAADPNDPDGRQPAPQPPCAARLAVYAPGTTSFADAPLFTTGCDNYRLFTPARRAGGRYVFRVYTPAGVRGPQRYHLQVAPADATDTAPGTFLTNHVTLRGALSAKGVDRVDLYRFQINSRSQLKLSLATGAELEMTLRNDRGNVIQTASAINREIAPGRYFVAVRAAVGASGKYRIRRASRIITRAGVSISGVARARSHLGQTVTVGVRLHPAVGGPVRLTFERFDPEAGWLYLKTVDVPAAKGSAHYGFTPPAVGRFRVRAAFLGTTASAGSTTGLANVLVVGGRG